MKFDGDFLAEEGEIEEDSEDDISIHSEKEQQKAAPTTIVTIGVKHRKTKEKVFAKVLLDIHSLTIIDVFTE